MNITRPQLEAAIRDAVLEALSVAVRAGSPVMDAHLAGNMAIKHAAKIEREAAE